jgi:hypothetical protein
MKKILMTLLLVGSLLIPSIGFAVTVQWNQDMVNTDGTQLTDLAGWTLYETTGGTRVKVNTTLIPPSSCTGTTTLACSWVLPAGQAVKNDTFVITCSDTSGSESGDSNTAIYKVAPKIPGVLIIR